MLDGTRDTNSHIKFLTVVRRMAIHIIIIPTGATILPVCPTCNELSAYPLSTAALDAPIAAPSLSARGSIIWLKFSADLSALPPEITLDALPKSGRAVTVISEETYGAWSGTY